MYINTSKSNILKTGISAVVAVILWAAFSFQSAVAGEEVSAEVKGKGTVDAGTVDEGSCRPDRKILFCRSSGQ
ncbi:MAG: hypothetical protein CM1200mP20_05460 [Pseudomonadota bacterium]|nr:MAG: hypothetical protein CM1200mP20_05460 [Pseudomonadota bacterium]